MVDAVCGGGTDGADGFLDTVGGGHAVFYHYTTGLYGRVRPAWALVPTVIVYAGQVVFSN